MSGEEWLDLLVVVAIVVVPIVAVWWVSRRLRVSADKQERNWQAELKAMPEPASLESFQPGPALLGGLSVVRYTPRHYLELRSDEADAGSTYSRFFFGGLLILMGIAIASALWRKIEDPAVRLVAVLLGLALAGAGVYAIFFSSPRESVRFDASRRVFETSRGEKTRARPFSAFTGVVMREIPIQVGRTPQGMGWSIELQRPSWLRMRVTVSEPDFDAEASFRNAAPLAKAIASLMRLPVEVRYSRWSRVWRWGPFTFGGD